MRKKCILFLCVLFLLTLFPLGVKAADDPVPFENGLDILIEFNRTPAVGEELFFPDDSGDSPIEISYKHLGEGDEVPYTRLIVDRFNHITPHLALTKETPPEWTRLQGNGEWEPVATMPDPSRDQPGFPKFEPAVYRLTFIFEAPEFLVSEISTQPLLPNPGNEDTDLLVTVTEGKLVKKSYKKDDLDPSDTPLTDPSDPPPMSPPLPPMRPPVPSAIVIIEFDLSEPEPTEPEPTEPEPTEPEPSESEPTEPEPTEEETPWIGEDIVQDSPMEFTDVYKDGKPLTVEEAEKLGGVEVVTEPVYEELKPGDIVNFGVVNGRLNFFYDIYFKSKRTGDILDNISAQITWKDPEIEVGKLKVFVLDTLPDGRYQLRELELSELFNGVSFFGPHFSYYCLSFEPVTPKMERPHYSGIKYVPPIKTPAKAEPAKEDPPKTESKVDAVAVPAPQAVPLPATGELRLVVIPSVLLLTSLFLIILKKQK